MCYAIWGIISLLLVGCGPEGPAPRYKIGDVIYSCVGHLQGQITDGPTMTADGTWTYWARFMTVSMEGHEYQEAELCSKKSEQAR